MAEEDLEEEVSAPIPTTTITLMVIDDNVRELLLEGCEAAEDAAEAAGEELDAYYEKVRDRLEPGAEPGKITLPNDLLTDEVLAAIQSYVATEIVDKDTFQKDVAEDARAMPVHPHIQQSMERLGLWEKD